ncbi:PREDICTED: putative leucine-rich repeat-containing protein DDB_G0290503 [Habropoda laboriosa]|uniref:putative leucine-rich repeat-containing protein DDB_G0290503 n=1 Tax=Habropoda laboriosa TaxID=597456 RepID=UPI00083D85F9|nr:PREDICTED: putative leucine-rich repeat-containing protein DDB_G0290503 [Habropoda laboriosa]
MSENLQAEIRNKSIKISQYEAQLGLMKQEISDFFNNLKYTLNNLEELNGVCEEVYSCTNCDLDIGEEANNILCNINIIMTRFQSYKIESQNLLQEIGDLKHYIENNKQQTYLNQNLESMICKDFYYDSDVDLRNTIEKDNAENKIVRLNVRRDKSNENEIVFEDLFNSTSTEHALNEITNNLNSYGLEKECHNYMIKLNRKDNIDEIEKEIIEYFSHFLIKLRFLIQKLQMYAEIERPLMIKQTYYFYEILKDTQSAINISQDVTLKKQLISDLYNQHKEEYKKYNSYIKQLPNNLLQVQNKINEFIETILHQLLNEILCTEKQNLCDEKINQAFEKHLSSCINRINVAIQGAEGQCTQIIETIEEQQTELQKKNIEIAQLKKEVAHQLLRRGEGDCLIKEQCENNVVMKEQLSDITAELNKKNALILKFEEQLQTFKDELSTYNKDCNALKKEKKNLENTGNRLLNECQQSERQLITKNEEIKNLSQQVQELLETENLKSTLENELKNMEKGLINLQSENNELQKKNRQANATISIKNETIISLKSKIDRNDMLSQKVGEYENAIEEKHYEIKKLEDENRSLKEKLKDVENAVIKMNQIIASLTEQNDKIDIIYTMQEDLTKIDKNEKKLKIELNNLRTQLLNDQNNNKKLDNKLDIFLRENDILKKNVEYWKNENSELSIRLCNEVVEEKLRSKLYIYQETKLTIHNVTNDLKSECGEQRREIKENEIEAIETQVLNNINIKEEIGKSNYVIFEQFNSSEDNSFKMKNKIKYPENEHNENQNEIEKLLHDIEIKDSEIRHDKEVIKQLEQKNADLHAILKSHIQEYQDKLMLMKKNYGSSVNALCERHKANIEILQKQFEDNMRCERSFDSENWLQSLNMKELIELHERVNLIMNSNSNTIHIKNGNQCFYDDDVQKQFYTKIGEAEQNFQMLPTNICDKELMQNTIVLSSSEEQNTHLKNQWQFIASGDTQKYPTLQTHEYKLRLEQNFGYINGERKSPGLENKYEEEKETEKDSTFIQQRRSFINQCSAYHKLTNTYECLRTFHGD